jgi:hypothetical protein
MGGLNSISGLNRVNIDYRPEVGPAGNRQGRNELAGPGLQQNQPKAGAAKSVMQQLDVLMLNAAKRSVVTDMGRKVTSERQLLLDWGVPAERVGRIESLAKDATEKLLALDKFTGRQIADAVLEKTNPYTYEVGGERKTATRTELVLSDAPATKAVREALDAQKAFSAELYKLNKALSRSGVDGALLDRLFEVQFQCDRRETEINSIVLRMHELKEQAAVKGEAADPRTLELLDAKFMDLMPREALMMHGTADSLRLMHESLGKKLRPLAAKLDGFAAKGNEALSGKEIEELQSGIASMKTAVEKVRLNGITVGKGKSAVKVAVDKSILAEMDKVLDEVASKMAVAKTRYVQNVRRDFVEDIRRAMLPEPSGQPAVAGGDADFRTYRDAVGQLVQALHDHANGTLQDARFEAALDDFDMAVQLYDFEDGKVFGRNGYDADTAKKMELASSGFRLLVAQYREMMASTNRFLSANDANMTANDVRRMFLGEVDISSVVEARARGFKAGDATGEVFDANIKSSSSLGRGAAGSAYLLTTQDGSEFVFKPELEGRIGLDRQAAAHNAYADGQSAANLNFATQETARALGCEDIVVKYSVGTCKGRFGMVMEKAPGVPGADFRKSQNAIDVQDPGERRRIKGQIARKLNRLQWLDIITGQGDRSPSNYFLHIDETTHAVTLKAIDNEASFVNNRIGVQKYKFTGQHAHDFTDNLANVCSTIHEDDEDGIEYARCAGSGAVKEEEGGAITVDLAKAGESREIALALTMTVGAQSVALPDVIDEEMYDKLMELAASDDAKAEYFATIAPRLSPEALDAAKLRLEDAIAHARKLHDDGKVVKEDAWPAVANADRPDDAGTKLTVTKQSKEVVEVSPELFDDPREKRFVQDCIKGSAPSYYLRDDLDKLFAVA